VSVCVCVHVSPPVKHCLCAFTCSETTAAAVCVYMSVCADKTRLLFIPVTSHPCTVLLPAVDSPLFMPVHWLLCAPPSLAHKEGLITYTAVPWARGRESASNVHSLTLSLQTTEKYFTTSKTCLCRLLTFILKGTVHTQTKSIIIYLPSCSLSSSSNGDLKLIIKNTNILITL